jgi:hypothetical protein
VTQVLLPVTVLVRRGYAAQTIWHSLSLRSHGRGHRQIAATLRVPAATVRGWLRRAAGRLDAVRAWFLTVAVRTGIDVAIPDGVGCSWGEVVAAVDAATAAVRQRFGPAGLLGAVTPAQVMVAASGGRLLSPGWPTTR